MKKQIFLAGATMLTAWTLSATTHEYAFTPSPADVYDLQHQNLYTWGIIWSLPKGEHISGATLIFKDINNWDNNNNILHLDLLDTAVPVITKTTETTTQVTTKTVTVTRKIDKNGTVKSTSTSSGTSYTGGPILSTSKANVSPGTAANYEAQVVDPSTDHGILKVYQDNTGDSEWQDEFVDPSRPLVLNTKTTTPGTTVTTKTDETTPLTSDWIKNNVKVGMIETTTYTEVKTKTVSVKTFDTYSWAGAVEIGDYVDTNGTKVVDKLKEYHFSKAQLDALVNDLAAGGDFALGFDPDCHFYNSGVELVITTVPDGGATAMLLGFALVGMEGFRRRVRTRF